MLQQKELHGTKKERPERIERYLFCACEFTLSILILQQMAARFMKFIRKGAEDTRIFYELDLPRTNDYFVQTFYDYLAPYVIICFTVREH